jgi:hypothetical protein
MQQPKTEIAPIVPQAIETHLLGAANLRRIFVGHDLQTVDDAAEVLERASKAKQVDASVLRRSEDESFLVTSAKPPRVTQCSCLARSKPINDGGDDAVRSGKVPA